MLEDGEVGLTSSARVMGLCSGEYILLIDSDTRVPEVSLLRFSSFTQFRLSTVPILTGFFWATLPIQDCFLDAASELDASPEVAILQHESDVMLVIGHYFENGEYICFSPQTKRERLC